MCLRVSVWNQLNNVCYNIPIDAVVFADGEGERYKQQLSDRLSNFTKGYNNNK